MNDLLSTHQQQYLPALTGIRFFAIFHIFLHHLWAVYTFHSGKREETQGLLISLKDAPDLLMIFMSNGWVSTNLFFMLSGFILAHLYWGEKGEFKIPYKQFLIQRFARIYPIHLIVLALLVSINLGTYLEQGMPIGFLIASTVGTATLVQAWFPPFVPVWSWPTWTISVMIFLYLIMPILIRGLNNLSKSVLKRLLMVMPLISIFPACIYALLVAQGMEWSLNVQLLFSNFPIFWIPYFVAGMLLSKLFPSFLSSDSSKAERIFSWGDFAALVLLVIACIPAIELHYMYFLRYTLLMPLYMVIIVDLARGKGLLAKVMSLSGIRFLGELGFSIFIWQAFVLAILFASLLVFPQIGPYQVTIAIVMIISLAIVSTHYIEKPLAKIIKQYFAARWTSRF